MPFLQRDTLQKEHSVLEKRKSRAEALLAAEHSQSTKIDRPPTHNLNPVTRYEEICADSWNRNNIVEARVPVQKADININASDNAKTEVYKTVLDDKHGTRDLELCCDCGTTFKVTGDNLNSIKVKSVTNKSVRVKPKSTTPGRGDDVSLNHIARMRAGSRRNDTDTDVDGTVDLVIRIVLSLIFVVCCCIGPSTSWYWIGLVNFGVLALCCITTVKRQLLMSFSLLVGPVIVLCRLDWVDQEEQCSMIFCPLYEGMQKQCKILKLTSC